MSELADYHWMIFVDMDVAVVDDDDEMIYLDDGVADVELMHFYFVGLVDCLRNDFGGNWIG
jgi:hypothetical protein